MSAVKVEARCEICDACGGDGHAVGLGHIRPSHFYVAKAPGSAECDLCSWAACHPCGGMGRMSYGPED